MWNEGNDRGPFYQRLFFAWPTAPLERSDFAATALLIVRFFGAGRGRGGSWSAPSQFGWHGAVKLS